MYELVQLTERTYHLPGPTNVGLVRLGGDEVCLIDSGPDRSAGELVARSIEARGWHLTAIFNTHAHADHTGANAALQERFGCPAYLPCGEFILARNLDFGPTYLAGGYPPGKLRGGMFVPEPYDARELSDDVLPPGFSIAPLPGHFFDMVGYRTPDDVLFLADSLASDRTLARYRIPFLYDVDAYLGTLERIARMRARWFVPAHADPCKSIAGLAGRNHDATLRMAETIGSFCGGGATSEQVAQRVIQAFGLPKTVEQYALVGSTVRSYLAYLEGRGEVWIRPRDGLLLWERV